MAQIEHMGRSPDLPEGHARKHLAQLHHLWNSTGAQPEMCLFPVCNNPTVLPLPGLINSSEKNMKTKQEVLLGYAKQANVRRVNGARS